LLDSKTNAMRPNGWRLSPDLIIDQIEDPV